jgi:rhodanese-related sulfurtransferase
MRLSQRVLLIVSLLVATVSPSRAETVQGRIKLIAVGASVLTLEVATGKPLLLNWDRKTIWKNVQAPKDLLADDLLAVDYTSKGDLALATTVSRLQTVLPAGMKTVGLETVAGYLDREGVSPPFTLIDVRPADRFVAGHLKGAVSVPLRRLEKRPVGILPDDPATPLVFYDDGEGDDKAVKAAALATKAGYANVAVFPAGVIDWQRSGRFLTVANSYVRKMSGIIVDLRTPERVAAGHIERAVSVPAAQLADGYGIFPMDRGMAIIVYGENDAEALAAARIIRGWGYRQVTVYSGGVAAWLAGAEVLTTEPAPQGFKTITSSMGGQLNAKDFELALQSPLSVQIVDVRDGADYARGHLPKTVHIPLQQLTARHGELDKEMIQVLFAADDVQAEMAADFLKQKGYRLNYLKGRVEFGADGTYQVK